MYFLIFRYRLPQLIVNMYLLIYLGNYIRPSASQNRIMNVMRRN